MGDFLGDDKSEIVTSGTGGSLLMLDGNLDVVASLQDTAHAAFENRFLTPVAANDIDGDGIVEVIAVSAGWRVKEWHPVISPSAIDYATHAYLVVAGEALEEECRVLFPGNRTRTQGVRIGPGKPHCPVVDIDGDGRMEIIIGYSRSDAWIMQVVCEGD